MAHGRMVRVAMPHSTTNPNPFGQTTTHPKPKAHPHPHTDRMIFSRDPSPRQLNTFWQIEQILRLGSGTRTGSPMLCENAGPEAASAPVSFCQSSKNCILEYRLQGHLPPQRANLGCDAAYGAAADGDTRQSSQNNAPSQPSAHGATGGTNTGKSCV